MRHSDKSACTWLIDDSGYLWHTVAVTREVALVGLPTVSATRSYCPLSPRITALASETNVVFFGDWQIYALQLCQCKHLPDLPACSAQDHALSESTMRTPRDDTTRLGNTHHTVAGTSPTQKYAQDVAGHICTTPRGGKTMRTSQCARHCAARGVSWLGTARSVAGARIPSEKTQVMGARSIKLERVQV